MEPCKNIIVILIV